jgi:hypothetical protein
MRAFSRTGSSGWPRREASFWEGVTAKKIIIINTKIKKAQKGCGKREK